MRLFRVLLSCAVLWLPFASGQIALSRPNPVEAVSEQAETRETSPIPSSHFDAAYHMASLSVGGITLSPAIEQLMREQLLQGFTQDTDFQELEQEFPGVTIAVVDAMLPVAVRQTEETTPALIRRLAILYAEEMTPDEIAVATEWFSSPAFSHLSATMESNMDLTKIIGDAMADTESQISSEDLEAIKNKSAARTVSVLKSEDKAVLMQFSTTSAFAKLEALKATSLKIETEWTNEENPDHDAEIESITMKALETFTGLDLSE